jgi:hypothetical protein
MIDIKCRNCNNEFKAEQGVSGICPFCKWTYWWEEVCNYDHSEVWQEVWWSNSEFRKVN